MSANPHYNLLNAKENYLEKLKVRNIDAYKYLMKGIEIIGRLNDKMFEAYIVGGAVRDILLNKDFNDIDICTTATPNEVMEIFPHADNRYADMGVITIREGNLKFEITFFVPKSLDGEIWNVKIKNQSEDKKVLKLIPYFSSIIDAEE